MNNAQWSSPDMGKLQLDEMDLAKNKGFTDLSKAVGESIKESITANNELTKQILKNIDTGKKIREEEIKFFTEFAPKAAAQAFDTIQDIKEDRKWMGLAYDDKKKLDENHESTVELNKILDRQSGEISGLNEVTKNFEGANEAVSGRNSYKRNRTLLNTYWTKVRPSIYEAAQTLEFDIDGKKYTLAGTSDVNIRREIRKRIDITIASHAYSTGAFGKREILDGILLKSNEENDKLVAQELAFNAEQSAKEYTVQKEQSFVEEVMGGNKAALGTYLTTENDLINAKKLVWQKENPDKDIKDYPGQSITELLNGKIARLIHLAKIGPENGGLSAQDVIDQIKNSGEYEWADGTKYGSIFEAYNKQHAGMANGWIKELEEIQTTRWDTEKMKLPAKAGMIVQNGRKELNAATNQEEYTAALEKIDKKLKETLGEETYLDYIDQPMKNRLAYKDVDLGKATELRNSIISMYESKPPRPVNPELLAQLPQFMQKDMLERYGNRVWSQTDTFNVNQVFRSNGTPLDDNILDTVFGPNTKGIEFVKVHLKDELNIELMGYYSTHFDKTGNHKDALRLALDELKGNWKWTENALDPKSPTYKKDKERLEKIVKGLAEPGIGLNLENDTQFRRRQVETDSYINDVVSKGNLTSNTLLFKSEEQLVGETNNDLNALERWIHSGGTAPIPPYYKRLSKATGIPVSRIALYRSEALGHRFVGDSDEGVKSMKTKLKDLSKVVNEEHPASAALMKATDVGQANLVQFSKEVQKDDKFISTQYSSSASDFAANNEDVTEFDYMQNVDQKNYKHDQPLSSMQLNDISSLDDDNKQSSRSLFGKGKFFNIGAFGIANETEFNRIYSQLYEKGLVTAEDKFDRETQIKFRTQALINRNAKLQQVSGIVQSPTNLSQDELTACGLGDQLYPLNEDICKLIHNKYVNK